jgi:alpha-beta hydrolase superfamily lysophospholipase
VNPHFFSDPSRALFGIHTPAHGLAETGIVICPPIGQEGLTAHRSLRILADQLAAAGVEVLRFDYYGTGDSSGDMRDGSLSLWAENVRAAAQHLRGLAPVRRVVLLGLRLGATLAYLAEVPATSRIILWDPVLDGRAFVGSLTPDSIVADTDVWEVGGFPFGRGLREEIGSIDLSAVRRVAPDIRVITTQESAGQPELEKVQAGGRRRIEAVRIQAPRVWTEDEALGVGAVPTEVIRQIVSWVI